MESAYECQTNSAASAVFSVAGWADRLWREWKRRWWRPRRAKHLLRALSYAPTNTDTVYFTDWTLLKQYAGAQSMTSNSDQQARQNFLVSVGRNQGIASFFDGSYIFVQDWAKLWGWDTTDLLWEATLNGPFPPIYVLKVRSDLDLSPVMAHFTSRGFSASAYQGATVYAHPVDLTVDWFNDPSIFNAA